MFPWASPHEQKNLVDTNFNRSTDAPLADLPVPSMKSIMCCYIRGYIIIYMAGLIFVYLVTNYVYIYFFSYSFKHLGCVQYLHI